MKKRKRILLVLAFVLLDTILIFGFLFLRALTFDNILKNEVNQLSKLDISKDRYNTKLKTKGGYRVVEKAIKNYLDDYAVNYQELSSMVSDEKLKNIVSYENVEKDGPNFDESLSYLDDFSKSYNERADYLLNSLNENTMKSYINSRTSSKYFRNLYRQLMVQNDAWNELLHTKELLINSKNYVNQFCDSSKELLNFLKDRQGFWVLENNEVKFQNQDDLNQYNSILSKIQKSN